MGLLAGVLASGGAWGAENIARGAAYTVDPVPAYEHCTDPGDASQLTDGVYSEGYFWTQVSTVGWQNAKPVAITLDLGKVQGIGGISVNTAAGVAGVHWPSAILILVADEDRQFYGAGELVALSAAQGLPSAEGYAVHRYQTEALQTHGRYVALLISNQPFTFVDEVEVYAGDPAWMSLPRSGEAVSDPKTYAKQLAVYEGVQRRLRQDAAEVREKAGKAQLKDEVRNAVLAELDTAAQEALALPTHYGEDFRTVLPLNAAHARVFRAHARLWAAMGAAPLTAWSANPWDYLSITADPPQNQPPELRVAMMSNEYRAAAFNLSNATQEDVVLRLTIQDLPGGDNPPYVAVHEVAWTDTGAGQPVAAALPLAERQDDAFLMHVPAGMTRQVWLTFHPVDVPAGEHAGAIHLGSGDTALSVPLTLHLYPLRFPEQPTLHFGGWDYTNVLGHYEVTEQNRPALIAHLREHFVDSPWAVPSAMPFGEYDAAGAMTQEPDTANFDSWVELWPGAAQYLVFAAVNGSLKGFAMGTPEFDRAVGEWATFWAKHAAEKGLKPEQIGLLMVDEPQDPAQDAVIIAWAKALHAANTGVRVWEDPIYRDVSKAHPELASVCDVLCPNREIFMSASQEYRDYYLAQRDRGVTLEFYSCGGPVRLRDPYRYHRVQAWICWQYGAKATYFWAFADAAGASSWNEYAAPRNAYTPLFIDAASITAGKHLEACREGIEDFEYLVMLRDAIAGAEARGVDAGTLDQARSLLADLPRQVIDAGHTVTFRWMNEDVDHAPADRAREQILETLVKLEN
jgi:hypothetical protein